MADKVTLANVQNLIDATTAAATINGNNAAIVAAVNNTLSRDGTSPNTMGANLDMNGFQILNLSNLLLTNVPTSNAGLPAGTVWNNNGVLSIV